MADLCSWKTSWAAESATFEEAKALRERLLKRWQSGGKQDRALARIVKRCRKGRRCGSSECPVCERRRRRRAKQERDMRLTAPQAPKVVLLRTSEIVPERIDWIWPEIIAIRRVTGLASGLSRPRKVAGRN